MSLERYDLVCLGAGVAAGEKSCPTLEELGLERYFFPAFQLQHPVVDQSTCTLAEQLTRLHALPRRIVYALAII